MPNKIGIELDRKDYPGYRQASDWAGVDNGGLALKRLEDLADFLGTMLLPFFNTEVADRMTLGLRKFTIFEH